MAVRRVKGPYRLTPKRRVALKKAQLASARARHQRLSRARLPRFSVTGTGVVQELLR